VLLLFNFIPHVPAGAGMPLDLVNLTSLIYCVWGINKNQHRKPL
jgi:hypothetical protein